MLLIYAFRRLHTPHMALRHFRQPYDTTTLFRFDGATHLMMISQIPASPVIYCYATPCQEIAPRLRRCHYDLSLPDYFDIYAPLRRRRFIYYAAITLPPLPLFSPILLLPLDILLRWPC